MSAPAVTGAVRAPVRVLDRPLTSYYLLLGTTGLLVLLGLVMVLSASSVESFKLSGSSFSIFTRQAVWVAIGVPVMAVAARLPVRFWRALAYPALFASIVLLSLVLVPGMGVEVNGNRNWIRLGGGLQLQPAEFAKLGLVLWGADLLSRKAKLLGQWKHLLVPLVPGFAVVLGLVMLGSDLGTAILISSILFALLWVAGAPARLFLGLGTCAVGLVALFVVVSPNRVSRFTSFMDPFADYENHGWQAAHSIFALASGGWWGLGLGASREKWGALPEAHTDFIFAIIGEELGLAGTLVVLGLFAALGYAGIRIASRTRDPFVRLAAGSVTAWLIVQATVNIGAVLGVLPITGVPLPLVSYGGSAMLPTMAALGMLLSFAKSETGAARALAARGPGPVGRALRSTGRRLRPGRGR